MNAPRADYHAAGNGPSVPPAGETRGGVHAAPGLARDGAARGGLRVAAVIPALDCAATIADVVAAVKPLLPDVLVVDDGSRDDTAALARAAGAEVLRHDTNAGKGRALQAGFAWASQRGFTHVFSIDGDGQHLASEIPALLDAARENPAALVLGERSREGHDISPAKLFGNRFANRWVEIASGHALDDTQSGFRVYPLEATLALGAHARHYGFETEVLIRALRDGVPVERRTVKVHYPPPDERVSHYRPWMDTIRIIFLVVGILLRLRRRRRTWPAPRA